MKNGWENFWDFIGVAFWVVVLGWIGVSIFNPNKSDPTPERSSYSNAIDYEPSNTGDSYDSFTDDYESDTTPSSYRSTYSSSYDKDCSDFDSWDDAQDYYENVSDDNLDGDGDGVACESLQ